MPTGRPPTCTCGTCARCKRAAYMRRRWTKLTPEQKRAAIAARNPDKVREQDRQKMAKRRRERPDYRARTAVYRAVRDALKRGELTKGPCELAGPDCKGRIEAHHDDYSQPLVVRWLCRSHHDRLHADESPDWSQYEWDL